MHYGKKRKKNYRNSRRHRRDPCALYVAVFTLWRARVCSQAAIDAANAGASMVHIHAREDNGKPTSDLDTMGQILSRIKEHSDVIIGITTGGAIGMRR